MGLFDQLRLEYDQLVEQLNTQSLDNRTRATVQRRASLLQEALSLHTQIEQAKQELIQARALRAGEHDPELAALCDEEIAQLTSRQATLSDELDELLYPADEHDSRNVYLEIRAGAGGQEAALFVGHLYEMYQLYGHTQRWSFEPVEVSTTDIGGYKELIVFVKGKNVYRQLKFESGVHRVQRVPATETQGRVHTSTVTVAVLPEADEVDIDINPSDLRVDTYRAGGAGGQHVNKTDSAVRITHLPTGIVVQCQDERSQIKNRAKAMKVLYARMLEAEKIRQEAAQSANRKQQVGSGERSEKIRTYNYPQNRITDHRVDLTLKKLDLIMNGDMGDIIDALLKAERESRRAQ